MRIVENFANHVDRSRKLKSIPDEDKEHLKDFIHNFQKSIIPMLLDLLMETASHKCYKDAIYTYENLASFNWATKMLDSYGKPESGILLGNLNWIGEYDECVNAYAPQKENTSIGGFHGKYCTMQIPSNSEISLCLLALLSVYLILAIHQHTLLTYQEVRTQP
ncbi:hypothetical protein CDAR_494761, partial [Caerostris darwini]